jgi:hypothetical protein
MSSRWVGVDTELSKMMIKIPNLFPCDPRRLLSFIYKRILEVN